MKDTTIKLDRKVKDWLYNQGLKGETYQDIIIRLIQSSLKKEVKK